MIVLLARAITERKKITIKIKNHILVIIANSKAQFEILPTYIVV